MRIVLLVTLAVFVGCGGGAQEGQDSATVGDSVAARDSVSDSSRLADSLTVAADPQCLASRLGLPCDES